MSLSASLGLHYYCLIVAAPLMEILSLYCYIISFFFQRFLRLSATGEWLVKQYNLSPFKIYDISNKLTSSVFAFLGRIF